MEFNSIWPKDMAFGSGALKSLPDRVKKFNADNVLIVTDSGIEKCGLADKVASVLRSSGIKTKVFAEVQPNPTVAEVNRGVELWKSEGFNLIIALGGGSSMDATKVISSSLLTGKTIEEQSKGVDDTGGDVIPFIAIPTTSGTGSEATSAAMVKDETGKKYLVRSFRCRPSLSLLDPELTVTVPARMTAATGMDALIHSLGAYTNKSVHPIADTLALKAISLVLENLPKAVENGSNLGARENMMLASYMSGIAISSKGNDAIHGLSTPVESLLNVTHGESLSALLPHVVSFNIEDVPEPYIEIANYLNISSGNGSSKAERFLNSITGLRDSVGVSRDLGSLGVETRMIDKLADMAIVSRSVNINSRTMSVDNIKAIYQKAI